MQKVNISGRDLDTRDPELNKAQVVPRTTSQSVCGVCMCMHVHVFVHACVKEALILTVLQPQ